jgi:hypothetical protein
MQSAFRWALILFLFPVILLTAVQAQADIVPYSNRIAFDAAGVGFIFETWDEFDSGYVINDGSTVNGVTYNYIPDTLEPRTGVNFMVTNANAYTTFPNTLGLTGDGTETNPYYFTYDGVQFVFSQPIYAFGIDIDTAAPQPDPEDPSAPPGFFQATTNLGDIAYSYFDPFPGYDTGQFIGFTSTEPFTSVTITLTDPDNYAYSWALDTMRVPLPPSLLLLGSGLAGLGLLRLRKRPKA